MPAHLAHAIANLRDEVAEALCEGRFDDARRAIAALETLHGGQAVPAVTPAAQMKLLAQEIVTLRSPGLGYVNCIKDVRVRTGLGLKETKDLVDQYIKDQSLVRFTSEQGWAYYN